MSITGVHGLLDTSEPEALREVLRDVFGWDDVEAQPGCLIFKLPPAELGVHPLAEGGAPMHQLSFMCDDLDATIADLRERGLAIRGEPENEGFGITTTVVLPGDIEMMLDEPRHQTAI